MCKEVQSYHYCMNIKHKKTPFQSQHGISFKQNPQLFSSKNIVNCKKNKKFVSLFESELSTSQHATICT